MSQQKLTVRLVGDYNELKGFKDELVDIIDLPTDNVYTLHLDEILKDSDIKDFKVNKLHLQIICLN